MTNNKAKYIIVGAGLSGLTSAYVLNRQGETDFFVLESRDRIGGRILTENEIDFGATWFQNDHENVIDLINNLNIDKFHQYSKGKSVLVYNTMGPAHYFEKDSNTPSAFRVVGGSMAMINALASGIETKIKTATTVLEIKEEKDGVLLTTNKGRYKAEKIIITIPPRIAPRILFNPELPESLIKTINNTHTWMSNAIKVGLTFRSPFWRHKYMSGMIIGQTGAVTELYDHSDVNEKTHALMGFINEGLRDVSKVERKTKVLNYLQKHLGEEVLDYITYKEKDWSKDRNTSCETIKSIYMSPRYGNSKFESFYLNGKVLFSGTETSSVYGGYMDGAVYSGVKAAKNLLSKS
ncbi:amine oxidoreductase [Flavivirga aquatica]|uniref:Amine oxidoreductase n=1 Tax=Flavivirga aquatica TaxID=1849968 RepID=A0A1E5SJ68_9FLAO|nr:NAD(P)/FAD-dependent oxidoreductase [Flavivirga aquatica]OEJ99106.1 amine oxidoreductase [Flavivirga aquatica]